MTAIQNATNYTTTYPQTAWYPATGTTWTTTTSSASVPSQPAASPAKPSPRERIKASAERIRARIEERKQARIAANVLPVIAGGSVDAEIKTTVEEKKKIVLERTVGIDRDKGGPTPTPTHTGKLTLVRDLAGAPHQQRSIGLKTEPNGTSYVEIPIDKLREALDDLDPDLATETKQPKAKAKKKS